MSDSDFFPKAVWLKDFFVFCVFFFFIYEWQLEFHHTIYFRRFELFQLLPLFLQCGIDENRRTNSSLLHKRAKSNSTESQSRKLENKSVVAGRGNIFYLFKSMSVVAEAPVCFSHIASCLWITAWFWGFGELVERSAHPVCLRFCGTSSVALICSLTYHLLRCNLSPVEAFNSPEHPESDDKDEQDGQGQRDGDHRLLCWNMHTHTHSCQIVDLVTNLSVAIWSDFFELSRSLFSECKWKIKRVKYSPNSLSSLVTSTWMLTVALWW